ncbi:hypothetical protein K413DRAFT_1273 [Clostridium sp. ASBs410]|nr:hypothetical protein K413DRAFT_1273 [Clostridium sp. ASBs410]
MDKIKDLLLDLSERLACTLARFFSEASYTCKICTAAALILLVIFIGFDIYENSLNTQTQKEIRQVADTVFDSPVEQIDKMDSTDQIIFQSTRDGLVELKVIWINLTTIVACALISLYIDLFKELFVWMKDSLEYVLKNIDDEPWTWVPFGVIGFIDLVELVKNFI